MKSGKKRITLIIAGLALPALAAVLVFSGLLGRSYTVNKPDRDKALEVADGFHLFSGDGIGFSFEYPRDRQAAWSDNDGAYIYCGEGTDAPYVLVCRANKRAMSPEKYFKDCDKLMLSRFTSVQSTPIQETVVGGKTLYLVRYVCDGLVIDRYLELYSRYNIQYTAISRQAGSLNTEVYYAINTLRVNEGAYLGAYSDKVSVYSHPDYDMKLMLPDMLDIKELTLGYLATGDSAVVLAVNITQDDNGKAIYNRQDFIDRAAEAPEFVAGLMGAESASFTEGQEKKLCDRSFYCYPMDMTEGGEEYSGQLLLANADETGCWLMCYAARNGCCEYEKTLALLEKCAASIELN